MTKEMIKWQWACRDLERSASNLERTILKNKRAKAERIWIENNPHIHLLNYPFYKLIRFLRE